MAEPKTRPTKQRVEAFLDRAAKGERREDCDVLVRMMRKATGAPPKMWGPSIVGFGAYGQPYADGKVREWPLAGFSPRKPDLTVYVAHDVLGRERLLSRLGKHRIGKVCLYIRRLSDVDVGVLERIVRESVRHMKKTYGLPSRRPDRAG